MVTLFVIIHYMSKEGCRNLFKLPEPTLEEKRQGLRSSTKTPGVLGVINRTIAKATRQTEVDFRAFVEHWSDPVNNIIE